MNRYHCTYCNRKRAREKLTKFHSPALKKPAWICKEHTSTGVDVFAQRPATKKLNGHAGVIASPTAYERSLVPQGLIDYLMECLGFLVVEKIY